MSPVGTDSLPPDQAERIFLDMAGDRFRRAFGKITSALRFPDPFAAP